jgi:hypothetical protein
VKKTISGGPGGLAIVMDTAEIFPDDPGQGTPVLVTMGRNSATWNCATDTGELDCGEVILTISQTNWLEAQRDAVENWIGENGV